MDSPSTISIFEAHAGHGHSAVVALAAIGASNDNVNAPRAPRETFITEEFVATRRFLKVRNQTLGEGSIGRILRVRSPGRLYDVSFSNAEEVVMTLSHCDIARSRARQH